MHFTTGHHPYDASDNFCCVYSTSHCYTLDIHDENGKAPLLSVFGGKLTTYRKLAEHALEKLTPYYQGIGPAWTKESVLPGGAIEGDRDDYAARLRRRYPFLTESLARHYARTYGSNSELLLGNAGAISDLGEDFGHEFYEAELKYLVDHEWVSLPPNTDSSGALPFSSWISRV